MSNDSDVETINADLTVESFYLVSGEGNVTLLDNERSLLYTGTPDFNGEVIVHYTIIDEGGFESLEGKITLTVTPVNDVPLVLSSSLTIDEDEVGSIDLSSYISDIDSNNLQISNLTANNGSVTLNGTTITYTPNSNYNGEDTISYTVNDGDGGSTEGSISITVNSVNDKPIVVNDIYSVAEEGAIILTPLSNDSDIETINADLTVESFYLVSGEGTITLLDNERSLSYTGTPDFNGEVIIHYTIIDEGGFESLEGKITLTVTAVNDAPVVLSSSLIINEDEVGSIDISSYISDIDSNNLQISNLTANNGSVTLNGTIITYTPNSNYNGEDTISYTVNDGDGGSTEGSISITINSVNDKPVVAADTYTVAEGGTIILTPLSNDSDIETANADLTIENFVLSSGEGIVTLLDNERSLLYIGTPDFNGKAIIHYTIVDEGGFESLEGEITLTVTPVNDAPTFINFNASTLESTETTIDISEYINDVDEDSLSISSVSVEGGDNIGTITTSGTSITVDPTEDLNGEYALLVTISDGKLSTVGRINLSILEVDTATRVNDDFFTVNEDQQSFLFPLLNDTDDDSILTIASILSSSNSSTSVYDGNVLIYTPNANFVGEDIIYYTVDNDGGGGANLQGKITIEVININDAPVFTAPISNLTVDEDGQLLIDWSNYITDIDSSSFTINSLESQNGVAIINEQRNIRYSPNNNYHGNDIITGIVNDGDGGNVAVFFSITVNSINDLPTVVNEEVTVNEDSAIVITPLANDSDLEDQQLAINSALARNGAIIISEDEQFITYRANANFFGNDVIEYTVIDSDGGISSGRVQITVVPINDTPIFAVPISNLIVDEDGQLLIDWSNYITDIDSDSFTINSLEAQNGIAIVNEQGNIRYTPISNYNGSDIVTGIVNDGDGGRVTVFFSIIVNSINDLPIVVNEEIIVNEDSITVITPLANDSDLEDQQLAINSAIARNGIITISSDKQFITYKVNADFFRDDVIEYTVIDSDGGISSGKIQITVLPMNDRPIFTVPTSNLTVNEDGQLLIDWDNYITDIDSDSFTINSLEAQNGVVIVNEQGNIRYTPTSNYNGNDTITGIVNDGDGGSVAVSFSVVVNSINDLPIVVNEEVTVNEDSTTVITPLANDSDLEDQQLAINSAVARNGIVTISSDKQFITYKASANFFGNDIIEYAVIDSDGGISSGKVHITVVSVNDTPMFTAPISNLTVDEDSQLLIDWDNYITDIDSNSLTINSLEAQNGVVIVNEQGNIRYTPVSNYNGNDLITGMVDDGDRGIVAVSFSITVNSINDLPVVVNEEITVNEDSTIVITPLANDSDLEDQQLAINSAVARNGIVTISNDKQFITYRANANFFGSDIIEYTAIDSDGGIGSGRVQITVVPVNDTPIFIAPISNLIVDEDGQLLIDWDNYITDIDSNNFTISSLESQNGVAIVNEQGNIRYSPNSNYNGNDTVIGMVNDGDGGSVSVSFSIIVISINDSPHLQERSYTINEGKY